MKFLLAILVFSGMKLSANPFIQAVDDGDIEKVKVLSVKEKNLNIKDIKGQTALMRAVERGYSEIVRLLIEAKVDVNIKDEYGKTALLYALEKNENEMVEVLLAAGADPEIKDKAGKTALFVASQKKDIEFKKNEYSDETKSYSNIIKLLIDTIRKKSIPKIPSEVIKSAEKEERVRLSPKNIFEYLMILPSGVTDFSEKVMDYDYGLRLQYFKEIELDENCINEKTIHCIRKGFQVVDVKNGYLLFRESGLEEYIMMALFKKSNGSYIVGVTKYFGGDSGMYNTFFLIYRNQKWIDITKKVLPKLSYKLLLSPKDQKLIGEEQKHEPRSRIVLPRYGTDISYEAEKAYSCEGDMGDDTTHKKEKCKMILKKIIRDSVKLKWNPDKGIFTLKL